MTFRIRNITFDCADNAAQLAFWSKVSGYHEDPANADGPAEEGLGLLSADGGPGLLFLNVPEGKAVKNRIHLDVQPVGRTRDEEVAWLLGLGAGQVADYRRPDGTGWVVLADPEGNEFCVERSAEERAGA